MDVLFKSVGGLLVLGAFSVSNVRLRDFLFDLLLWLLMINWVNFAN